MPAEQWMILGESDVDGCFEETACGPKTDFFDHLPTLSHICSYKLPPY